MTVRLRAHHLCMLTYIGKGYSPAFTDNMTVIAGRVSAGEKVEIVEGPDEICAPRLAEANAHRSDDSVYNRDLPAAKDVGRVLQVPVHTGTLFSLSRGSLKLLRSALANKMARQIWAMLTKNEDYKDPALAVAA